MLFLVIWNYRSLLVITCNKLFIVQNAVKLTLTYLLTVTNLKPTTVAAYENSAFGNRVPRWSRVIRLLWSNNLIAEQIILHSLCNLIYSSFPISPFGDSGYSRRTSPGFARALLAAQPVGGAGPPWKSLRSQVGRRCCPQMHSGYCWRRSLCWTRTDRHPLWLIISTQTRAYVCTPMQTQDLAHDGQVPFLVQEPTCAMCEARLRTKP